MKIQRICTANSTIGLCRCSRLYRNVIAHQSTDAVQVKNDEKKLEVRPQYPILDTKFNQYQIAYRYRHTLELLRGYLVYRLFSINFLVNNQDKVKRKENEKFFIVEKKIDLAC